MAVSIRSVEHYSRLAHIVNTAKHYALETCRARGLPPSTVLKSSLFSDFGPKSRGTIADIVELECYIGEPLIMIRNPLEDPVNVEFSVPRSVREALRRDDCDAPNAEAG
jgi:hypothetical protein